MLTVQEKISQLLWNKRYLVIPNDIEQPDFCKILIIKDPTLEDRNHYLIIRQIEEDTARAEGVPDEKEIMVSAKIGGLWTNEDELILQKTDAHISLLEHELKKQKFEVRRKKIKAQIEEAFIKKKDVNFKIEYIKSQTAEHLAHEAAVFSLLPRIVFRQDGCKLWLNEAEFIFDKKHHTNFVYFIAKNVLSENVWPEKDIREVAKNPEWRMIWTLNRESLGEIFHKNLGELNLNQKLLIYWSRVYDSAFESTERPEFDIIQNDEKFDNWLLNREQESKNPVKGKAKNAMEQGAVLDGEYSEVCIPECGALSRKGKGLGESPRHLDNCPYGVFRKYTEEEKAYIASQIYGENSDKMRQFMNKEMDKIEKAGLIEEHHLRDKNSRKVLGAKSNIIPIHKR